MNEADRNRYQDRVNEDLEEPLSFLLEHVRNSTKYDSEMANFRTQLAKSIVNYAFQIAWDATHPLDKRIEALEGDVQFLQAKVEGLI